METTSESSGWPLPINSTCQLKTICHPFLKWRFSQVPTPFPLPQNRRILEWNVLGDESLHLGRNQSIRDHDPSLLEVQTGH